MIYGQLVGFQRTHLISIIECFVKKSAVLQAGRTADGTFPVVAVDVVNVAIVAIENVAAGGIVCVVGRRPKPMVP